MYQVRDEKMDKLIMQLDLLSKHVANSGKKE